MRSRCRCLAFGLGDELMVCDANLVGEFTGGRWNCPAGQTVTLPRSLAVTPLRQRMLHDMQIRNLTGNTQQSYILQASGFAGYFRRSPEVLGRDECNRTVPHRCTRWSCRTMRCLWPSTHRLQLVSYGKSCAMGRRWPGASTERAPRPSSSPLKLGPEHGDYHI